MSKLFGFIGCGNMGGAIIKAVSKAGFENEIIIADHNEAKTKGIAENTTITVSDSQTVAKEAKFVFIGVKPQVFSKCFEEIKAVLNEKSTSTIIVSMAAGIAICNIKKIAGDFPVIRIMPNMPVSIGQGVTLASSCDVSDDDKAIFEKAMIKSGIFDWLDEKYIDAASAVSGCGPAYAYMFIEALADGAVACGLPRDKAQLYASGMLAGSALSVIESGKHPGKLKDEVCSPGGSTIAGVNALENGGLRATAMNAVIAAYDKTKKLGK